jgi:hypothetical protein
MVFMLSVEEGMRVEEGGGRGKRVEEMKNVRLTKKRFD